MKVLVGIDGSEHSGLAVRFTAELLSKVKDQIALCYALPQSRVPWAATLDDRMNREISAAVFSSARSYLPETFRDHVEEIVSSQDPRSGLVAAAADCRADLLAVGAKGAGPVQRLLLGSVSQGVVHTAPIPVLVVRDGRHQTAQDFPVLFAHDGSRHWTDAAELLSQFSWPAVTLGRVMTVIEPFFPREVPQWLERKNVDPEWEKIALGWLADYEKERQSRVELLAKCQAKLPEPFHRAHPIVAEGNPAEQILKLAEQQNARLIIIGRRGLGMTARWLLGSTSEPVLSHAPCSVLVLPRPEE